jgi:hypothetical protein
MTLTFLIYMALISSAQPVAACSVCYGEPNSPMSNGVEAGVLFLLGVVVGILTLMASVVLFWIRRAANLADPTEIMEKPTPSRHHDLVNF